MNAFYTCSGCGREMKVGSGNATRKERESGVYGPCGRCRREQRERRDQERGRSDRQNLGNGLKNWKKSNQLV